MSIARAVAYIETEPTGASFVWPDPLAAAVYKTARYPHTDKDIRYIEDISMLELAAAIQDCAEAEDPIMDAARRFGIKRLTAGAKDRLLMAKLPTGHIRV